MVLFQAIVVIERIFFPWSPSSSDRPVRERMMQQPSVIRGGRVLDIAASRRRADILIGGDTIVEIGQPGMAAPDDADVDRRRATG